MLPGARGSRLGVALGGAMLLLTAAVPAASQDLQPGEYRVSSGSSGLCLDAERGSRNAGSKVQQFDCHGGLNQRLRLLRFGDLWVLRAMHSDLCLSVDEDGVLTQADCQGSERQFFQITAPDGSAPGEYFIRIGSRCLEELHETSPYRVAFQDCSEGENAHQRWTIW